MNVVYRRVAMVAVAGIGLGAAIGGFTVGAMDPLPVEIRYADVDIPPVEQSVVPEPMVGIIDVGYRPRELPLAVEAQGKAGPRDHAPDLYGSEIDDVPAVADIMAPDDAGPLVDDERATDEDVSALTS